MISPYKILSLRYFSAASLKKSPEEQSYNAARKHCIQDENNCNTTLGTTHFYLDLEIVIPYFSAYSAHQRITRNNLKCPFFLVSVNNNLKSAHCQITRPSRRPFE